MISLILAIFSTHAGFAYPPQDIINMVQGAMHPGITSANDSPSKATSDSCNLQPVTVTGADPITNQPRTITLHVYQPKNPPTPLNNVLLFPPTGGENFIDRYYAGALCDAGVQVAILADWQFSGYQELDLDVYDRAALRTLAAAEHTIEYLNPQGTVGLLGTSVGAIGGAFVLGYDARITTSVLIVGGDDMANIIATSNETKLSDWREKQMAANNIQTTDAFEQALQQTLKLNPSTFADYTGPKKLMMYIGTKDTTVPTADQMLLRQAYGNPPDDEFAGSHVETVLHTYTKHRDDVVGFFKTNL